jgi:D-erythronate 2-dehydrogenase
LIHYSVPHSAAIGWSKYTASVRRDSTGEVGSGVIPVFERVVCAVSARFPILDFVLGETMKVLITGGAGYLGRRLALNLLERNGLTTGSDVTAINELLLVDRVDAEPIDDPRVHISRIDITQPGVFDELVDDRTTVIFHLAAVVSGQAEADFDLGMAVNLDGSRALLETCRRRGHCPRVVFTSSVAVYGGALPDMVRDDTALNPRSSYGVEKAMAELLLSEYTRRQFVDGRALRLPTVSVRPGRPNQAASSFASGIIREPLAGEEAVCPVPGETRLWLMSPRTAIDSLIHGYEVDAAVLGDDRVINLCGLSITVASMLESLQRVGGDAAVRNVRFEPDAVVQRIVGGWPGAWDMTRARALGFPGDNDFDEVIRAHIEDSGMVRG